MSQGNKLKIEGGGKQTLTSFVLTTPLTYFPRTESMQRTLDSTARHRSLSPTLTSIFLSPQLPLVCSPSSQKPVSARERALTEREESGALAPAASMHVPPLRQVKLDGGCLGGREGGGGGCRARARFRSCFVNATCPHAQNAMADYNHVSIRGHALLMKLR